MYVGGHLLSVAKHDSTGEKVSAHEQATASLQRASGRSAFDADGRGIWEWQVSTGVLIRTVTEEQLMDLAQSNLQLPKTANRPITNSA